MRQPLTRNPAREVVVVQQLRGLAALLVVLYHAAAPTGWLFNPLPVLHFGIGGVDIFFLISGFVMFVAARHEPPVAFWYKRLARIVPLYWLVTLLFFAMRLPHLGEPGTDLPALVRSLLFIPYRPILPDGPVVPLLVPGWTLNLEMLFYLLFGLGLALRRPVTFAVGAILLLVAIGALAHPHAAAAALYTRPILLEFAAGIALGALWVQGRYPARAAPLALPGLALLLLSDLAGEAAPLARASGAMMVMIGALGMEAAGRIPAHPLLKSLGDASYSIYLIHTPVLLAFRPLFARLPLGGWPQLLLFLAGALLASALAGWALHRWVERPIMRVLRDRRRLSAPPSAATP